METIIKSNYTNVEEINVTKFINEIKADANNNYRHTITVVGDQFGKVLQALQAHGAKVRSLCISSKASQITEGVIPVQIISIYGYLNEYGEISLEINEHYHNYFAYKNKVYQWREQYGSIHIFNNVLDKAPYEKRQYFVFDEKAPNNMFKPNLRAIQRWVDYLERKEQAAKEHIQRQDDNEARLLGELDKAGVKYQKSGDREYTLYCGIHRQKVHISDTGVTFYTPDVDWSAYQKAVKNFNGEFADLALLTKLAAI